MVLFVPVCNSLLHPFNIPGSKIGKADSLSRRPDWEVGIEKDNEDETMIKPE